MGRLVQQPPPARAGRQHPAGGSRSQLPRRPGGTGTRSMTQTKRPPTIPGQFNLFDAGPLDTPTRERVIGDQRRLLAQDDVDSVSSDISPVEDTKRCAMPGLV